MSLEPIDQAPTFSSEDLAQAVGGEHRGATVEGLRAVVPLDEAGPEHVGFLASASYLEAAITSSAGALLVGRSLEGRLEWAGTAVIVDDAHQALAQTLMLRHPTPQPTPGVHPTAVVAATAKIADDAQVGAYAVISENAEVGSGTRIEAHVVVGPGVHIGPGCHLYPHVVLYAGTRLGARVIVHAGARLGVDGFGYVPSSSGLRKVPQVGSCVIEDDVEIGANTCIDRGSIGTTRVGAGSKLDNLVHLAHNVQVGAHSILVAQVGVAGSSRLGQGVQLGGQVGVSGHLSIGDGARVGAQAGVIRDIPAGQTAWGTPARPRTDFLRKQAGLGKIPELLERVKALEASLATQRNPDAPPDPEPDGSPTDTDSSETRSRIDPGVPRD